MTVKDEPPKRVKPCFYCDNKEQFGTFECAECHQRCCYLNCFGDENSDYEPNAEGTGYVITFQNVYCKHCIVNTETNPTP